MADKSEATDADGKSNEHDSTSSVAKPTLESTNNHHFHPLSKKFRRLPPWLDHFNAKDLKTLFKCCVAVWVYTLFIVINPTLRAFGQATFFGVIVLVILPPSGVIFIALMGGLTLIIGMCLGWAWGTMTMKAALATRPAADLAARYAELQESATRNTTNVEQASGQATFTQVAIFDGFMLDPRVSVTYFCMMGLFVYLMSRLRGKAPKLALLSIFAIIVSDVYLTIAPLVPQFQGTLPQTFLKPASAAIGVGLVCNILFFPRSTSHFALDSMQDVLSPMTSFLEACQLNLQNSSLHMDLQRLKQTKTTIIKAYEELQQSLGFLQLDASMGRWSADDIKTLQMPLRQVLATCVALLQVQIAREEYFIKDERLAALVEDIKKDSTGAIKAGRQHIIKAFDFRQRIKHPDSDHLRDQSLLALSSSGHTVINACQDSILDIKNTLRRCNTRRWFKRPTKQQCKEDLEGYRKSLTQLHKHNEEFSTRTADPLWNLHAHFFDEQGHLTSQALEGPPLPVSGIVLALVLEETVHNFTCAVEDLLKQIINLEENRTVTRLWLPGNLQHLLTWATNSEPLSVGNVSSSATPASDDTVKQKQSLKSRLKTKREEKKSAASKVSAASQLASMKAHGGRTRNKVGQSIVGLSSWFSNDDGMYALRVLIVTIAMGCPAVIPSSAGFYYREKGLWALIMAQTALTTYTSEFVVGLILRVAATIIGGVVGLAAWYIGAGNGPGNPFGIAAIMAVFIVVVMWLRLFLPPSTLQAVMITAATCYLVVSYSWVDTHIPSYGNPGVGYPVFWRRILLVIIGFCAAAIVTLFPRPPSANRHYRQLLSETISTVQNQYSLLLLNYKQPLPDLREVTEDVAIRNAKVLLEVEPQLKSTKFEYSSSSFDTETLEKICRLSQSINYSVAQLLYYVPNLPENTKERFLRMTNLLDDNLMGDIMAIMSILQSTLETGAALPSILPTLHTRTFKSSGAKFVGEDSSRQHEEVVLSKEILGQPGARRYCSAMSAFVQFLRSIDELVVVMKLAVGETGRYDDGLASSVV